jgi:excisionase family DNA binding protein
MRTEIFIYKTVATRKGWEPCKERLAILIGPLKDSGSNVRNDGRVQAVGGDASGPYATLPEQERIPNWRRISSVVPPPHPISAIMDVAKAAKLLRIHPKTLRNRARRGIIPGVPVGRLWRFRASALNEWLDEIAS